MKNLLMIVLCIELTFVSTCFSQESYSLDDMIFEYDRQHIVPGTRLPEFVKKANFFDDPNMIPVILDKLAIDEEHYTLYCYLLKNMKMSSENQLIDRIKNTSDPFKKVTFIGATWIYPTKSVVEYLMSLLDDKTVCMTLGFEELGEPRRICDVSYNQICQIFSDVGYRKHIENGARCGYDGSNFRREPDIAFFKTFYNEHKEEIYRYLN